MLQPHEDPEEYGPVYYPESDGKPMAETDTHRDEMIDPFYAVRWHLRNEPDTYVSANLLLYYEKGTSGHPARSVAPDLFVVRGVGKQRRRIYRVWEEGRAPDLVLEVSSSETWEDDLGRKKVVYARLGVPEYYLFDPTGDFLDKERLRAFRLQGSDYEEVKERPVVSRVLGLELHPIGESLRLVDPRTGVVLPVPMEAYEKWAQAEERVKGEAAARAQAESRAEREAAARAQAESAREQAETAREQAESAREQAEERALRESAAREAAERRMRALQEELDRLRGSS